MSPANLSHGTIPMLFFLPLQPNAFSQYLYPLFSIPTYQHTLYVLRNLILCGVLVVSLMTDLREPEYILQIHIIHYYLIISSSCILWRTSGMVKSWTRPHDYYYNCPMILHSRMIGSKLKCQYNDNITNKYIILCCPCMRSSSVSFKHGQLSYVEYMRLAYFYTISWYCISCLLVQFHEHLQNKLKNIKYLKHKTWHTNI